MPRSSRFPTTVWRSDVNGFPRRQVEVNRFFRSPWLLERNVRAKERHIPHQWMVNASNITRAEVASENLLLRGGGEYHPVSRQGPEPRPRLSMATPRSVPSTIVATATGITSLGKPVILDRTDARKSMPRACWARYTARPLCCTTPILELATAKTVISVDGRPKRWKKPITWEATV